MTDSTQRPGVTLVVTMRAQAGKEFELEALLASMIGPTRADAGLIDYELYRDVVDPTQFCFIERWESEQAHAAHVRQSHVIAFASREAELLDGGIDIRRVQLLDRC